MSYDYPTARVIFSSFADGVTVRALAGGAALVEVGEVRGNGILTLAECLRLMIALRNHALGTVSADSFKKLIE